MNNTVESLLTPEDLADVLGITRRKVVEYTRRFGWEHTRMARRIRYTPAQVAAIVERHTRVTVQQPVEQPDTAGRTKRSRARAS